MKEIRKMKVRELMTNDVIHVNGDTLMTEVKEIFDVSNFHHLPVVNSFNAVIGIISTHELKSLEHHLTILGKEFSKRSNSKILKTLLASDVMKEEVVALSVDDSVSDAIDLFLENDFHSIIILEKGLLRGILTPYDILLHIKNS